MNRTRNISEGLVGGWGQVLRLGIAAALALVLASCGNDAPTKESVSPAPVFPTATNPDNGTGACLQADTDAGGLTSGGGSLNCTSEDVDISNAQVSYWRLDPPLGAQPPGNGWTTLNQGDRIQCTLGQTVYIDTDAVVENNAQERYDLGLWLAPIPGNSAKTGESCNHYNLLNTTNPAAGTDLDGDSCGDVQAGVTVQVDLGVLAVECADPDGNGSVELDACAAWQNSDNRACPAGGTATINYRYGTTPETKAKCRCEPLVLPIDIRGRLRVVKATIPDADLTDFTFTPTGWNGGATFTRRDNQEAFTSGLLSAGTYSVAETVPADWELTLRECFMTAAPGTPKTFTPITNGVSVNLLAGEDVTCRFTDTKKASLDIEKISLGGVGTFSFVTTGSGLSNFDRTTTTPGTPTANAPFPISVAQFGDKYVQETVPAGWTLTNIVCTSGGATVVIGRGGSGAFGNGGTDGFDQGDNTVKITVGAGNTPTCTFTNTKNASLDIEKVSLGGVGTFSYVATGSGLSNFDRTTTTAGTPTANDPFPINGFQLGDKYVQETVPAGWALTNIVCTSGGATVVIGRGGSGAFVNGGTDGFDAGDNTVKITVGAGNTPSCTFENTRVATIDIEKVSLGGVGTFSYLATGSGLSNFDRTTTTAGTPTANDPYPVLPPYPADKYVQETVPAGWTLTNIVCTSGGATVVIGRGGSAAFVNGGSDGFDQGDNTVKITVGAGNTPSCTFTNTKNASLDIEKVSLGAVGTFSYLATGSGLSNFDRTTTTPGTPTANDPFPINGFQLGDKYVQETVPAGWTLTNIVCTSGGATVVIGRGGSAAFGNGGTDGFDAGDNTVKITVGAGNTPSCTFTNSKNASLAIQKRTIGATGSFSYTGTGSAIPASFSRNTGAANPTTEPAFPIDGFQFGIKYVQETVPAGYALTDIVCTSGGATVVIGRGGSGAFTDGGTDGFNAGDNTVKITVGAGNTPSCTFTNTELGTIIIEKENPSDGTKVFTFTRTLSGGGADLGDNPAPSLTNGQSSSSGKKLLPGNYVVCETNLPAGYQNPTATGYVLTESPSGTFCTAPFSLAAGETKTVHFINALPPGGGTRTIGYWKNWSTCTNGRQAEQAYARNMPELLLDFYLGGAGYVSIYPIGLITTLDCGQAVNLLSKDAINGSRRPGDPIYNMVAQFLGAKLNMAAGAGTCSALTSALGPAQALLVAVAFDGLKYYSGRNVNFTLTPQQLADAHTYAALFGSYNEGTLGGGCPLHL